jgi:hypothetical protein
MQIDYNQLNQGSQLDLILSILPYPVGKNEIVAHAQEAGANPQIVTAIKQVLPDQKFDSPEDIKKCIPRGGQTQH